MTYIKLETVGDKIKVNMEGEPKDLVGMFASSIINDENFAKVVIAALVVVAEQGDDELSKISLN